ncbi:MAG: NAD-dependent epimerase/dehydratase family protein [Tistlia sp.]|uniref:NAD-dependent epimerase/dehydratase family protein n=1 Tax=Tistlia sp. TaxID=3057121 RepID=UPI0034A351CA
MSEPGRILVTGGAGFIGSHLVELLLAEGRSVRVMERPGAPVSHLPGERIEIAFADLREAAAVREAAAGCEVVLHLAANPNLWSADPDEFEEVNHQGTRRVLAAARAAGARRLVHVSTESILSPPGYRGAITEETEARLADMIGDYCRSKWLAEQAAREAAQAGDPVVIVRPSVPVGPGDRGMGPFSRMVRDFSKGRIKAYLRGNVNLIDVRDVASGIWVAAQRGAPGRPYLLVNENWTIVEVMRFLSELTGRPAPRWPVPYGAALLFAYLEEGFHERLGTNRVPMATVTGVKLTRRSFQFDGRQSAAALGLGPLRDCRGSIAELVDYLRAAGQIPASES